jgi:hypothetical protein
MTRILQTEIKSGERLVATDITDLTFFPKGTILTFSSEAWTATSAAFKTIWKICDGQNGTPNLVNKFLRGAAASGTTAGTDSQSITLITANLPAHNHTMRSGGEHAHTYSYNNPILRQVYDSGGDMIAHYKIERITETTSSNNTAHVHTIDNAGSGTAFTVNTVPTYFTVIYIMKVA